MTITQTVEIPVDRQISLKLPLDLPVGKAKIIIFSQEKKSTEDEGNCVHENCPLYSDNPPFNETTLAAMQEARDIASGKIPGKWHQSIEEMHEELNN